MPGVILKAGCDENWEDKITTTTKQIKYIYRPECEGKKWGRKNRKESLYNMLFGRIKIKASI